MARFPLVLVAVGLLAGCQTASAPTPPEVIVDSIDVDRVEVRVGTSRPAQVSVLVEGRVGDGCTELLGVSQMRSGSTVELRIQRKRPVSAICTQQLRLYNEVIALTGAFSAGDYQLVVNGSRYPFRVD
jgi:hypothetical protein